MNEYHPGIYGVKIREGFVAVEEANPFGELSKYDFVLKDCLVESYNGNDSYRIEVMREIRSDAIINGWQLKKIDLPGNWFGQNSYFCIIDKMGNEYRSPKPVLREMWYVKQPVVMIRETLLAVLKFTQNTPSVKYAIIMDGFDIPKDCNSIEKLHQFTSQVEKYLSDYMEVLSVLESDNDVEEIKRLKEGFDTQIRKCYPFTINIESLTEKLKQDDETLLGKK